MPLAPWPDEPKMVTPGWDASRPTMLRAYIGSSTMASLAITLPNDASVVLTCVAAASTMTVVVVEPILANMMGTVAGALTCSSRLLISTSVKPGAFAVSL